MQHTASTYDPKDFRRALGMFGTGVTIVTTRTADGLPIGITANSFNSVSLEPPMVLWSLAKSAYSLPIFQSADTWNVHILAQSQEALSNRFARAGEDKFAGLALDSAAHEAPLLPGCSARFQCKTAFQYDGGDHIIFVGEVLAYDSTPLPPLLYVTGGYALASRMAPPVSSDSAVSSEGHSYNENLLGYLFGRAHFQFLHSLRPALAAQGLSEVEFYVLSTLAVQQPQTLTALTPHLAYCIPGFSADTLQPLLACGLLQGSPDSGVQLSAKGSDAIVHVLAAAKATETHLTEGLGELEASALRNLLKKAVAHTDPGLPKLWQAATPA